MIHFDRCPAFGTGVIDVQAKDGDHDPLLFKRGPFPLENGHSRHDTQEEVVYIAERRSLEILGRIHGKVGGRRDEQKSNGRQGWDKECLKRLLFVLDKMAGFVGRG